MYNGEMKNQYFGDLADYRKYGLLRTLAGAGLSAGVCWMLTPDDDSGHGNNAGYLRSHPPHPLPPTLPTRPPRPSRVRDSGTDGTDGRDRQGGEGGEGGWEWEWEKCDPELFRFLAEKRRDGRLHVAEAESAPGIFGDADFHSRPFCGSERREYFADARRRFRGRDLVFLDPDKGLRPRRGLEDAHLDWDDAAEMFAAGHSLAVTQFPRWGAPEGNLAAVAEKRDALAKRLRAEVRVVHFCRHPWLFFLVAVQPRHAAAARRAVARLRRQWREPRGRAKVYAPDCMGETLREVLAARGRQAGDGLNR